jgi:hypothetical protein
MRRQPLWTLKASARIFQATMVLIFPFPKFGNSRYVAYVPADAAGRAPRGMMVLVAPLRAHE